MKKIKYPIHKSGKYTGYEEMEDGSISIADTYAKRFGDLGDRERAIIALSKVFADHLNSLLLPVEKERRETWDRIIDDFGIDREKFEISYSPGKELIIIKPKNQESGE